jgi:signal transduction histidine kinase
MLREISVFADLAEEDLEWLTSRMTVRHLVPGDILVEEGTPADRLFVTLHGEFRGHTERAADDGRTYTIRTGMVSGMLPYSRLTHFPLTVRALVPGTVAELPVSHFPEMLRRIPVLGERLVGVMADRIRETTKADQQRDKLIALGKLSAGLAHELNNPAAAVRRAAVTLKEAVRKLRTASLHLEKRDVPAEDRIFLARLECDWLKEHPPQAMDSLARSDREEQLGDWLDRRNVPEAWNVAADLVDAGCDLGTLEKLGERFQGDALAEAVTRLAASSTITRLVDEVESGTSRMGELVRAIKEYSYMDQMPEQEIDVHTGLENTLIMLKYRLKHGVDVIRDYDRSIPKICAYGSELNQVWTNLIENAIDAMKGKGTLRMRTAAEIGQALVEITDSGSGIPPNIRDRIFEPFFTTKPVGEGTGLGLDAVYRIVRKHRGDIRVDSKPGETRFQVRLPFSKSKGAA